MKGVGAARVAWGRADRDHFGYAAAVSDLGAVATVALAVLVLRCRDGTGTRGGQSDATGTLKRRCAALPAASSHPRDARPLREPWGHANAEVHGNAGYCGGAYECQVSAPNSTQLASPYAEDREQAHQCARRLKRLVVAVYCSKTTTMHVWCWPLHQSTPSLDDASDTKSTGLKYLPSELSRLFRGACAVGYGRAHLTAACRHAVTCQRFFVTGGGLGPPHTVCTTRRRALPGRGGGAPCGRAPGRGGAGRDMHEQGEGGVRGGRRGKRMGGQ